MASYFSTAFFVLLLPITVLLYGISPRRIRCVVLLVASYVFIWVMSGWLIVFVWASTLVVYVLALCIGLVYRRRDKRLRNTKRGKRAIRARYKHMARAVLVVGVLANLGILAALKYLGFFESLFLVLTKPWGSFSPVHALELGAPIGISFYSLMAVSYLADVYRETTNVDSNLIRVALYLSFFPQIMEGPLSRYSQTAEALTRGEPLDAANMYAGLLRMSLGFVKKLLVADRINPLVTTVFSNYESYDGGVILVAAVLYTTQLYCDFSGTMDVAVGLGRMFNIALPENFRQPFFSLSTSEFWQRWHITLGAWFKDYVFYPVTLSKPCKVLTTKARRCLGAQLGPCLVSSIALFCVWMCNGLWHGAGSQYMMFGMYYFMIIFCGSLVELVAQRLAKVAHINRAAPPYVAMRMARTIVFVIFGELIFRAVSSEAAVTMLQTVFSHFSLDSLTNGTLLGLGMDTYDFRVVYVTMGFVLIVDLIKERGVSLGDVICRRGALVRWMLVVALCLVAVVFGAYGYGYAPVDPLYAQY